MASGAAKNKTLEHKCFLRKNDSQSVAKMRCIVTDGVIVWFSSILEFSSVKLNLILYHSCCLPNARSLVVLIWARLYLSAHNTSVYSILFHKVV